MKRSIFQILLSVMLLQAPCLNADGGLPGPTRGAASPMEFEPPCGAGQPQPACSAILQYISAAQGSAIFTHNPCNSEESRSLTPIAVAETPTRRCSSSGEEIDSYAVTLTTAPGTAPLGDVAAETPADENNFVVVEVDLRADLSVAGAVVMSWGELQFAEGAEVPDQSGCYGRTNYLEQNYPVPGSSAPTGTAGASPTALGSTQIETEGANLLNYCEWMVAMTVME